MNRGRKFYKAISVLNDSRHARRVVFWEHTDRSLFTAEEIDAFRKYYPEELFVAEAKSGNLEPAVIMEKTAQDAHGEKMIRLYDREDYALSFRVVGFCMESETSGL
ncbi:MAG: hypothetical protein PHQ23_10865 [Candidatus Wallbacteria bacterium]|nr:hypothetical protein [Candidatus Wallbacteria bacterium]